MHSSSLVQTVHIISGRSADYKMLHTAVLLEPISAHITNQTLVIMTGRHKDIMETFIHLPP